VKKARTLILIAVPVVAAAIAAAAVAQRADCPCTTICPLTGEVVCVDRCPAKR
jgi:hypothetical protein